MVIQKNTLQTLDLKWLILISIIIHVSILMYVKIDKQPIIKPAEINIVLEKIIEIPVPKKNIQPKVESIKKSARPSCTRGSSTDFLKAFDADSYNDEKISPSSIFLTLRKSHPCKNHSALFKQPKGTQKKY